jgi:multidrug efflux pump subunit AcrA (membrane-fusion protein)
MSEKIENIELRNEEVQEILTRVPNWLIIWGNTLILILLVLVLFISWFVKYPDVISADVLITTNVPPQKEYAKLSGRLDSIYVQDAQYIDKNQIIAVFDNYAITEDIYYLKSILDSLSYKKGVFNFPLESIPILILGDVEITYAAFENSYAEYKFNKELNPFLNQAKANRFSYSEQLKRLGNLNSQFLINENELSIKKNDLNRNKLLLEKGVISKLDFEKKQLEILGAERGLKSLSISISQTREALNIAQNNTKGTEINRTTEESKLLRNTIQTFNQLRKAIDDWEQLYVLKSEIKGKVAFLKYWNKNQTVNQGDLVFTIIPESTENYVGKLKATAKNSGKIKIGQTVNISLDNYPEAEFGMLKGYITSISLTPDEEDFYLLNVSLPEKLLTTYQKEIEFKQEMKGRGDIITEDLRLLERFLYQFKSIFKQ